MIDNETGEVMDSGFSIITHEEKARRSKAKKEREERERIQMNLGNRFIFVRSDGDVFCSLSAANAARLIYICTFSDYSGNLMLPGKRVIYKTMMPNLLRLSRTVVDEFLKEVSPEFIRVDEDDGLHLNSEFLRRGSLGRKSFVAFQKFYDAGVRKLYRMVSSRQHKHIGYVFMLLRYVNIEYNMLCHNVYEKELDAIVPMTVKEFCEKVGYDVRNTGRLIRMYEKITFDVWGRQEYFCTFNYRGDDKSDAVICINPNILYNGTRFEEVKVLGAFCKVRPHSATKQHDFEKLVVMGVSANGGLEEKRKNA